MQPLPNIISGPEDLKQHRLFWSVCFLGWCALVTVTASIISVFKAFPILFALQLALGFWGFYVLATPLVLWLARRFPLHRNSWRVNIWVHVAATAFFVLLCEGGFAGWIKILEPRATDIMAERRTQIEASSGQPAPVQTFNPLADDFEHSFPKPSFQLVLFKSQFGIPIYWVLVGVAHSLAAMAALREREKQAALLTAHLTQAQLAGLRTQLQPHFLFNTLNSIAALIPQNAKLATEMVLNLSDLLRMTLREPQRGGIQLIEELTLLQHYVDIQKLRFGERLSFRVEASDDALNAFVPPLLLQPLVENAIRHGVEPSEQVECITVRARIEGEQLVLEVANTLSGDSAENRPLANSTGVGLSNTRARLKVQYDDQQDFQAGKRADGGFEVRMRFPARSAVTFPSPSLSHEN
jgi:two-component system LytT family sensor kinase